MTCIEGAPTPHTPHLFLDVERAMRERLLSSELGGLLPHEKVADLFCGAGGWGEGMRELPGGGLRVDFAVNHDAVAIGTHQRNNPWCIHHQGDAWRTPPRLVVGDAVLGLLCASAACTTHSRARGAAPISPRVHMLGWCIARWMKDVSPRLVEIENVPEWQDWGPTIIKRHRNGKPVRDDQGRLVRVQDPQRRGQHFRRWWRYCLRLGYQMELRVLDAPDYGAASRRRRLFIKARRDGMPIVWPEKTHGSEHHGNKGARRATGRVDGAAQGVGTGEGGSGIDAAADGPSASSAGQAGALRMANGHALPTNAQARTSIPGRRNHGDTDRDPAQSLRPYRTAAECINFQDLGTSIFERPRPLKPKTLARICEGIRRYVLNDPAPFLLRVTQTGGGSSVWSVTEPMPTQTTRQDVGFATPVVAVCAHGDGKDGTQRWGRGALPVTEPLNSIHAGGNNFALATPVLQVIRGDVAGRDVRQPMPTITAGNGPGRGAGCGHAMGIATPILATTGYGEREGQRARVHQVNQLLGTSVDGIKQALVTPVLMNNTSGHQGGRCDAPAPTITTGGQMGLVSPVLIKNYGGVVGHRVDEPMGTITGTDHHAIAAPVMAYLNHGEKQTARVDEPLRTVVAGGGHAMLVAALMMEFYGASKTCKRPDQPLGCVTTLDRHGLVSCVIDGVELVIVDILFRMLRPLELAAAMGFRPDFAWTGVQRSDTRLIGNAVSPVQARALIGSSLPLGRLPERREAVVA